MWEKIKKPLQFLLGWPLSFVALFFIVKTFLPSLKEINTAITHINIPLLLLGLVSFFIYYSLRSIFWAMTISFLGYTISTKEALFLWSSAQLKRYIPGNIWGVLGMTVLFSEKGVSKKDIARGILLETEIVVLSTLLLAFLAIPFLAQYGFPFGDFVYQSKWIIFSLYCLGVGIYLFGGKYMSRVKIKHVSHLTHLFPPFTYQKSLYLLLVMTSSYVFFGLGTFLAITSIAFIDPQLVLQLSGYFVLSLIIGFLSFITPTGLGVREGAIALGLSKVMALSLASFSALFARVIVVIAEIIFVFLAYLLTRVRNRHILNEITFIKNHLYESVVTLLVILFSLYFAVISVLRYVHYYTGRFDLGNMTQTVWNTAHGRIFELTDPNGTEIVSRLAFHADFILILFAPFYWIWETPNTLLVLQAIIVSCGAFFVYFLAKDILKSKPLALLLSFLYLLNPSVQRATIYDFHAVTLATTFLLGAFYFLQKKRYGYFLLFSFLAGITKEQIWAIVALLGLYAGVTQKQWKLGLSTFVISVAICYGLIWHAIPAALGGQHFAVSYYTGGETEMGPTGIIKNALFSPIETITTLIEKERVDYLRKLLGPLGYTSLLSPFLLIFALPDLTINLLSGKPQLYQIYYQYTAAITPFLFISSMYGLRFLKKVYPRLPEAAIILFLLTTGLHTAYSFGPLPGSKESNIDMLTKSQPYREQVDELLLTIPESASVAASNTIGSHLSHRKYVYTIPVGWDTADYVIFDRTDPHQSPSRQVHTSLLNSLRQNGNYILIYDDGNLAAFRKRTNQINNLENSN